MPDNLPLHLPSRPVDFYRALCEESPAGCDQKQRPAKKRRECDVCNEQVPLDKWDEHLRSTVHLFHQRDGFSRHHFGIGPSNKGYQLLKKNGWNEETGLGPELQGRVDPIPTVFRSGVDRRGVGVKRKSTEGPRITHVPSVFASGDEERDFRRLQTAARRVGVRPPAPGLDSKAGCRTNDKWIRGLEKKRDELLRRAVYSDDPPLAVALNL